MTVAGLCGVLSLAGGLSAARADAPATTVTITSPTIDETVSGTMHVALTIDHEDTQHPVTRVAVQVSGHDGGHQYVDIPVSAGECDPTCSLSASFDTDLSELLPGSAWYDSDISDGQAQIYAAVLTTSEQVYDQAFTTVDNGRPTMDLPELRAGYSYQQAWGGDTTLSTDVTLTPNSRTGAAITAVRVLSPNDRDGQPAFLDTTVPVDGSAGAGGTIPVTVSLAGLPAGGYRAYFQAVASDGQTSALALRYFSVGHWSLSEQVDAAWPTYIALSVVPSWTDGSTKDTSWLTSVSARVDGGAVIRTNRSLHVHDPYPVRLPCPVGSVFDLGDHTVDIDAVDNRGISHHDTRIVTVANPIDGAFTLGEAVVGQPLSAAVRLIDASGVGLDHVAIALDGQHYYDGFILGSSLTFNATTSTTAIRTAGQHELSASVSLANGTTYDVTQSLTARTSGSATVAAHLTSWGGQNILTARLVTSTGPLVGRGVRWLTRRAGSTDPWTTVARTTTRSDGTTQFSLPTSQQRAALWSVIFDGDDAITPIMSPDLYVTMHSTFGATPTATRGHAGQRVTFAVTNQPADADEQLALQLAPARGAFRTVVRAYNLRNGRGQVTVTLPRAGRYTARWIRAAGHGLTESTSKSWTVTISPAVTTHRT